LSCKTSERHNGETFSEWNCSGTSRPLRFLLSWRIIPSMNVRMIACFAFCCSLFGSALARQPAPTDHSTRRIYVEPFVTQEGSQKFREDVIAELRKAKSVSLALNEASADAILGGGGEVWIKGYRSHNPQLGNVAPNGTPIYTGFLSIELRDKSGQTLWSYLATPPAASGDVAKDLSVLIAKKLSDALEQGAAPALSAPLPQPTTVLSGAGA